jgi:hypothetical protein
MGHTPEHLCHWTPSAALPNDLAADLLDPTPPSSLIVISYSHYISTLKLRDDEACTSVSSHSVKSGILPSRCCAVGSPFIILAVDYASAMKYDRRKHRACHGDEFLAGSPLQMVFR